MSSNLISSAIFYGVTHMKSERKLISRYFGAPGWLKLSIIACILLLLSSVIMAGAGTGVYLVHGSEKKD